MKFIIKVRKHTPTNLIFMVDDANMLTKQKNAVVVASITRYESMKMTPMGLSRTSECKR